MSVEVCDEFLQLTNVFTKFVSLSWVCKPDWLSATAVASCRLFPGLFDFLSARLWNCGLYLCNSIYHVLRVFATCNFRRHVTIGIILCDDSDLCEGLKSSINWSRSLWSISCNSNDTYDLSWHCDEQILKHQSVPLRSPTRLGSPYGTARVVLIIIRQSGSLSTGGGHSTDMRVLKNKFDDAFL